MKLGNIGSFVTGGTPSRKHPEYYSGSIPWVSSTSLGATYITDENVNAWITTEAISNSSTKVVQKDSILIGIRVGVGKCSITTFPLCTSQDVVAIEGIDTSQYYLPFVLNFINSKQPYFDKVKRGATIKGITTSLLKELDFPNIPMSDQIKISNSLDKISSLIRDYKNSVEMLDVLVKSRFVEMFGDPASNPKQWPKTTVGQECYYIKDGPHKSLPSIGKENGGHPFISVRNIVDHSIDFSTAKYISDEDYEAARKKCCPAKGDMLYSKGGTTGIAKLIDVDVEFANWVHLAVLKYDKQQLNGVFFENMLNSEYCYKQSQRLTKGIANRDLVLSAMAQIEMYHPPYTLQEEFAVFVQSIDKSKSVIQKSLDEAQLLFDSLMQEYFG